jgi:hypothetical protein
VRRFNSIWQLKSWQPKCYVLKAAAEKDQGMDISQSQLLLAKLLLKRRWIPQLKRFKFMVVMGM